MEIINSDQCPQCLSKNTEFLDMLAFFSCVDCGYSWVKEVVEYKVNPNTEGE